MLIAAEANRAATNVSGSSSRELNARSNGSSLSAELRAEPDVGRDHRELARPRLQALRELDGVTEPFGDGLGQPVAMESDERRPPEVVRFEDIGGLHLHEEPLVCVNGVQSGGPAGKRAG